ncbi:MAG: YhbY family RNA-binding protein [Proteobacteria bacterium]|nr:YhbY family RNA-binding protein [Pseudomonadota bacterium]
MNRQQRSELRGRAHKLPPGAAVGDEGMTDAFVAYVESAFATQDLIKVRFPTADRKLRKEQQRALAESTGSEIVLAIGKAATFFRALPDL